MNDTLSIQSAILATLAANGFEEHEDQENVFCKFFAYGELTVTAYIEPTLGGLEVTFDAYDARTVTTFMIPDLTMVVKSLGDAIKAVENWVEAAKGKAIKRLGRENEIPGAIVPAVEKFTHVSQIVAWFTAMNEAGYAFHPDDSFTDMVDLNHNASFSKEAAEAMDDRMQEVFMFCTEHKFDVYSLGLEVIMPEEAKTEGAIDECVMEKRSWTDLYRGNAPMTMVYNAGLGEYEERTPGTEVY